MLTSGFDMQLIPILVYFKVDENLALSCMGRT